MKPDSEFPGDAEGGMFGLRRAFEPGPPPKSPSVHSRLAAALLARLEEQVRLRKRRGRRPVAWRSELRPVVAEIMRQVPKATAAEIARELFDAPGGPNLKKTTGLTTARTIETWLSQVKRLNP